MVRAQAIKQPVAREKKARKGTPNWLKGLVLPLLIIVVWQIISSSGVVSATVLPSPIQIVETFYGLVVTGLLFGHLQISIYRAVVGFLLGASIALVLGFIVGFSKCSTKATLIQRCKCYEQFLV